jgi:adenylyl- and sulfurtransferase ThiI
MRSIRALGLLSGSLDSTLAASLLLDQGVGHHLDSPTARE